MQSIMDGLIKNNVLTIREKEVLLLAEEGLSNKLIADKLSISPGTVKKHLDNIFKKLEVCNKIEALNKIRVHKIRLKAY